MSLRHLVPNLRTLRIAKDPECRGCRSGSGVASPTVAGSAAIAPFALCRLGAPIRRDHAIA